MAQGDTQGLVYVNDAIPGITRRRRGKGFSYYYPDGELVRDPELRSQLDSLAIPPAYRDVWICPGRAGPQAVHLSPALDGAARTRQVRASAGVRCFTAAHQAAGGPGSGARWLTQGEGAGGGRTAARDDTCARRQQQLRQGEQLLRSDDHQEEACGAGRRYGGVRVRRQGRAGVA